MGGCTVEIHELTEPIILDCEQMNAYAQNGEGAPLNKNGSIYAPEFPHLQPGETSISWTGGIKGVEIIPRWWEL